MTVSVEKRDDPPKHIQDALDRATYHYNSRETNGVFWQPEGVNPWFESRAIHPTERVPCITVRTVYGRGWLLEDEVWDALRLERMRYDG